MSDIEHMLQLTPYLKEVEQQFSRDWNRSNADGDFACAIVVGHKAKRDFGVYGWAFSAHRFHVVRPVDDILWIREDVNAQLPGIGAVLCHSIFTDNCFRSFRNQGAHPYKHANYAHRPLK